MFPSISHHPARQRGLALQEMVLNGGFQWIGQLRGETPERRANLPPHLGRNRSVGVKVGMALSQLPRGLPEQLYAATSLPDGPCRPPAPASGRENFPFLFWPESRMCGCSENQIAQGIPCV